MKLRGKEFGRVFCAAGARNFFGTEEDAYWFHRVWVLRLFYGLMSFLLRRPWGHNYAGSTFVSKTTTLSAREGNMPLKAGTVLPRELFPKCVVANFWGGYALNKVGLSGPGTEWLLQQKKWQRRGEPFVISFMSVATSKAERLEELRSFVMLMLTAALNETFSAPVAIEINLSCPNVGLDQKHLVEEAQEMRGIFRPLYELGWVMGFKLSVEIEARVGVEISKYCDFLTITNTIGYGKFPGQIDWRKLFGSDTSPLAAIGAPGGGGLSGKPLLPLVVTWIAHLREFGVKTPIIGGGGILSVGDARKVLAAGADAVSLGCVSMLRPWRVASIIHAVNNTNNEVSDESFDKLRTTRDRTAGTV